MRTSRTKYPERIDDGDHQHVHAEAHAPPPSTPSSASLITQCAKAVRGPSARRELNFDDTDPPRRLASGWACHFPTKRSTDALLEPPAALADFLRDPSLLPKKPPTAARAS